MQVIHTPSVDTRYWTAISLASIFGANTGDFVSRILHLGHWLGLAPLAAVLAGVLLQERRSSRVTEVYYWLAIIIVRTAATNLADLLTHDFRLNYAAAVAVLAVLLVAIILLGRTVLRNDRADGLPVTDSRYWVAMLTAGTLGTAAGDAIAGGWGLGVGLASTLLCIVMAAMFGLRGRVALTAAAFYWPAIVVIRTVGTTVGDLVAHTVGLAPSTVLTGLLFVGTLALWPKRRQLAPNPI